MAFQQSGSSYQPMIHTIQWAWGENTELAFDPSRDILDFGWFSGTSFSLSEVNGSIVISIPSNLQSYTLTGVSFANLSSKNIVAKDTQAQALWEHALSNALPENADTPPVTDETTPIGGAEMTGGFTVTWAWNQHIQVQFDPQTDQINFGWFGPDNFSVTEVNGSVVISITGNQQTYTLQGVSLDELTIGNVNALDSKTLSKWQSLLSQESNTQEDAQDNEVPDPLDPVDETPTTDSGSEPEPEPAPAPQPDPVPQPAPGAPEENSPPSNTDSEHTPIISAYFPEWAIYGRDYNVADIPADDLTHLIYAFAQIDSSGRMALFDPYAAVEKTFSADNSVNGKSDTWDQELAGNFNQLAQLKALHPDLNVMIAVGGWTLSGPFSDIAATAEGRANFADSAKEFLSKYSMFDGLDFDWEYPSGGGLISNTTRPEDGENYALLLQAVRERLDELEIETSRTYEISVASPAGSDKIDDFNLTGLEPYVDFFNLMAYDFHGGWENITGHQAPMFDTLGGDYDIVTAVDLYKKAGVDGSKIVLGAPAYTRAWGGAYDSDGDGGWQEVTSQLAPGSFEQGVYDYKDVAQKVLDPNLDWKLYWDDGAQAAYVHSENEGIFSSFETPTSIALKSQWAQSEGLGGMMFWDLSGDITSGSESLTSAAHRSWYGGETVEQISSTSALQVDVVIGGNGLMDSFVDFVYRPPESQHQNDGSSGSSDSDSASNTGSSGNTTDQPPSNLVDGEVFKINWSWGSNVILDFNTQTDTLDFGWVSGDAFTLSEQNGSVVIEIASNQQSYTLQDVLAIDLSMQNIQALDASANTQWGAFLS